VTVLCETGALLSNYSNGLKQKEEPRKLCYCIAKLLFEVDCRPVTLFNWGKGGVSVG
jgi:hypothetical protein